MPQKTVMLRRYETSIDRLGLAIGAGGLIGGAIAAVMMAIAHAPIGSLAVALLVGTVMTALAITALAALPWAMLHAMGRCGPISAALLGAAIGFVLFLGGQTWGYGFLMPPMDVTTLVFRWASGIATSLVMAAMAGGIAVVMWLVAYRRVA